MPTRRIGAILQSIQSYLQCQGEVGATMAQIYAAVERKVGQPVSRASIRSVIYNRLQGIARYKPMFERVREARDSPIRLLRTPSKQR